jgi:DNA invertase Pin-like site-specific DNA recombinase
VIAIGYVRRSKAAEDTTVSLQEQQRQIEEYCLRHELLLACVVVHNGVSGGKRSRWSDIARAVADNHAKALIIYNLDRLSRDVSGLLDNLQRMALEGVTVHEVGTGRIDLKRASSKLMVAVRGATDEFYRDMIAEKTRDALAYKRSRGEKYTNLPPLGYEYSQGKLLENPQEQHALEAISLGRSQGWGARRIVRQLKSTGYQGRLGVTTVHKILHRGEFSRPVFPAESEGQLLENKGEYDANKR